MRRHLLSFAVILFCIILAGGSEDETAEQKRDRVSHENGISTAEYDADVRDYGSFEAALEAKKLHLSPDEYRARQAQESACQDDWHRCIDNSQLVNHYSKIGHMKGECKDAANEQAKFGDPKWNWLPFSSFYTGYSAKYNGKLILVDDDVQFSNGFGAMLHMEAVCRYDLIADKVEDVTVTER